MTDLKSDLTNAEQSAKVTALNAVNKQESWVRANKKALIIGAAVALVLGFIVGRASAQTASTNTAVWTWGAVTSYSDGSAIPSSVAVTYNLYTGAKGAESTTPQSGLTATTVTTSGYTAGQTICGYLTAVANGKESAHSNESCKSFPFLAPAAPVLTVQ